MYASMTNPRLVFNLPKLLFKYAQMGKLGDLLPLVAYGGLEQGRKVAPRLYGLLVMFMQQK